jgi:hypothetical protein
MLGIKAEGTEMRVVEEGTRGNIYGNSSKDEKNL